MRVYSQDLPQGLSYLHKSFPFSFAEIVLQTSFTSTVAADMKSKDNSWLQIMPALPLYLRHPIGVVGWTYSKSAVTNYNIFSAVMRYLVSSVS